MDELHNGDDSTTRRGRQSAATSAGHQPLPGRPRQSPLSKVAYRVTVFIHFSQSLAIVSSDSSTKLTWACILPRTIGLHVQYG